jgi:hypothetical protein
VTVQAADSEIQRCGRETKMIPRFLLLPDGDDAKVARGLAEDVVARRGGQERRAAVWHCGGRRGGGGSGALSRGGRTQRIIGRLLCLRHFVRNVQNG